MIHLLFDNDRRYRLRNVPAVAADDELAEVRSSASNQDEAGAARARRQRDDPSGRRSLTGLELRVSARSELFMRY
jgi:hypothetical protein